MGHHGDQQKQAGKQEKHGQEQKENKHGHVGEAAALGAAALAIYEHHKVKADPKHAGRHRLEETIAGATAVGVGLHELQKHYEQNKHHTVGLSK